MNLTPTQVEAIERSKAFRNNIAARAANLKPSKPTVIYRYPRSEPVLSDPAPYVLPPIEKHWFSMVEEIGAPLPTGERPSLLQIQKEVARHFMIRRSDILSQRRTNLIVIPRQIAAYISKDLTLMSLPMIGKHLGGRDHTTILSGIRKIARLLPLDPVLAFNVAMITRALIGDRPQ